jgi:plastocyanin
MLKWFAAAPFLALAVLGATACGDADEEAGDTPGDGAESGPVTLEADDFYFEPAQLTAEPGQLLTVKVQNNGAAEHTFTVNGLGIDEEIPAGKEKDIEVTSTETGEFEFYCRYHHSNMTGTITIGQGGADAPTENADTSGGDYGY